LRYFFSDPHFNSPTLIRGMGRRYPGTTTLFESAEAFDTHLIDVINATVQRDDELFCLGDWSKDKPGKYRARINCKHIKLILGNHDSRAKCENVFGQIREIEMVKLRKDGGTLRCILCHYPQAFWSGSHRGYAHLYGHTHGQREGTMDKCFPGRRSLDITVDNLLTLTNSYAPVSEEWLYNWFMPKPGHDKLTHYQDIKKRRDWRLGL